MILDLVEFGFNICKFFFDNGFEFGIGEDVVLIFFDFFVN